MSERLVAIGADGARGGWLAVRAYADGSAGSGMRTAVSLCPDFSALTALRKDSDAPLAVDVPMGLLNTVKLRPCDEAAQELLESRRSTVFAPPSRPLLTAASYAEARARIELLRKTEPEAKSLSAQAFGIAPKIREADDWLAASHNQDGWLYECHPELSFRALAGEQVLPDKKSAHGQAQRLQLIQSAFPDALTVIADTSVPSRAAELVDVLDAYAVLASALRIAAGTSTQLGGETDARDLVMRIVF